MSGVVPGPRHLDVVGVLAPDRGEDFGARLWRDDHGRRVRIVIGQGHRRVHVDVRVSVIARGDDRPVQRAVPAVNPDVGEVVRLDAIPVADVESPALIVLNGRPESGGRGEFVQIIVGPGDIRDRVVVGHDGNGRIEVIIRRRFDDRDGVVRFRVVATEGAGVLDVIQVPGGHEERLPTITIVA